MIFIKETPSGRLRMRTVTTKSDGIEVSTRLIGGRDRRLTIPFRKCHDGISKALAERARLANKRGFREVTKKEVISLAPEAEEQYGRHQKAMLAKRVSEEFRKRFGNSPFQQWF